MGASAEAYLLFDADATSDHLKALEFKTDTTAQDIHGNKYNFEYFAEVGRLTQAFQQQQELYQ